MDGDPPVLSEAALLARLEAGVRDGRVRLAIDRSKLSHIDFPLALEADGNRWVYALAAATALAFWQLGPGGGAAVAAASVVVYQTLGRRDVARRLEARVRRRGLASVETWRRLWRFGGVVLTGPDGRIWQGPEPGWMALARELRGKPNGPPAGCDQAAST